MAGARPAGRRLLSGPVGILGLALAGAALIEWSAALHLYLWAHGYRHIPTVGPLFLAQGLAGILLGLGVAAWRRWITALAGAGYLAATAVGLLVTAWHGMFGFRESLMAPYAGLSLVIEWTGAAVLAACAGLALRIRAIPAGERTV